jgi:alpha-galactosidase
MVKKWGRKFLWAAGTVMLLVPVGAFALNNGYARTPPMGFSTWNYFGCNGINEANVMAVAQSMVQIHAPNWEGKQISLQSVGYKFINLDDCWPATSRLADSAPTWNTTKFSHGFPWLTDTIHKMGLKIGIYSCCGTATCAGYIGSYGYEKKRMRSPMFNGVLII